MSSKTAGNVVSGGCCEGVELVRGVGVLREGVELVRGVDVLCEGVGKGSVGSEDVVPSLVGSIVDTGSIVVDIGSVPKNTGSDSGPTPAMVRAVTVTL